MTPAQFRSLVLSLPNTTEAAHMGHADFRVDGKIFATLGYPDDEWAMVKLPPELQEMYVTVEPTVFTPGPRRLGPERQHQCAPQGGNQGESGRGSTGGLGSPNWPSQLMNWLCTQESIKLLATFSAQTACTGVV